MSGIVWTVTGGREEDGDDAGILVRTGLQLRSEILPDMLLQGSDVEEIERVENRLHYKLVSGTGPAEGWISISSGGRTLCEPGREPFSPPPTKVGPKGEEPLPSALVFPGQGSQYVGMYDGVKHLPSVLDMFEKANKILDFDVLELVREGPEEKLEETKLCQPAMFIAGMAAIEKLKEDVGPEAYSRNASVAGFSLGEYTALCAAGVLGFEEMLELVKLRAEAMQEAAEIGEQKMMSVVGLRKSKVEELCKQAAKMAGGNSVCQIAICLFKEGFSIGGNIAALEQLEELAKKAGASNARMLKTSGGFHTPLMQPALDKLESTLDAMIPKMKSPHCTVWMNASATPFRPGCDVKDLVALMKKQLIEPVLWDQSIKEMIKEGCTQFYECGASKQLKAMMKRLNKEVWDDMQSIECGEKTRPPPPKVVGKKGLEPMPTLIMFPGQGSQVIGMMQSAKDLKPVKELLKSAETILGYDVLEKWSDTKNIPELDRGENAPVKLSSPGMFVANMVALEVMKDQEGPEVVDSAAIFVGFSIGMYSALCAAGCCSFEDMLSFVKTRSVIQQEIVDASEQLLMSVVGLELEKVQKMCKEVMKKLPALDAVDVAVNCFPKGVTVSGSEAGVKALKAMAEEEGAQLITELGNQAFHSPLMKPALEKLDDDFKDFAKKLKSPLHTVWCTTSGEPLRPGAPVTEIVDELKKHMTKVSDWKLAIESSLEELAVIEESAQEARKIYEVGPSKQLKTMMKRIDGEAFKSVESIEV